MTEEQARQHIAAHERRAAEATDPHKRQQHMESARHYRVTYGIDPPSDRPAFDVICAEWTRLGLDDAIQDFWRFHQGQAHPGIGEREYQAAFRRLRKLALIVCRTHKRKSVWIPSPVGFSAPMEFVEVKPLEPGNFKQLEVTT